MSSFHNADIEYSSLADEALSPALSICLPTYNRGKLLANCIESFVRAGASYWDRIELLVSDNASTDETEQVVKMFQTKYPIKYYRNLSNMGAEWNIFACAARARADYVWIFGDDDEFCGNALEKAFQYIDNNFDLIVANFSVWSREMDCMLDSARLSHIHDSVFDDPNSVLSTCGMHLGYISGVIIRRNLLAISEQEYERCKLYSLPHAYCIYHALLKGCHVAYEPTPIFKHRSDNSTPLLGPDRASRALECFVRGPAIIYEALERDGYNTKAVRCAKTMMIRKHFSVGWIARHLGEVDRKVTLRMMFAHYRSTTAFWLVWLPVLIAPKVAVALAYRLHQSLRGASSKQ